MRQIELFMPTNNNLFSIDVNTQLIIYGCTERNRNLAESLKSCGYKIIAFFDQRAIEIKSFLDLPVHTIDSAPFSPADKSQIVIIIGMQNLLQHEAVAASLVKAAYSCILGLVPTRLLPHNAQGQMFDMYNLLLAGYYSMLREIPKSLDKWPFEVSYEFEKPAHKPIWIPIELCFTVTKEEFLADHPDAPVWQIERLLPLFDKNISDLAHYNNLFDWLETGVGDIEKYLAAYAGDESHAREKLKSDRLKLYKRFCKELTKGTSFFEHSPASVKLDSRGRYIIFDGLHRCLFLIRRGYARIPALQVFLNKN